MDLSVVLARKCVIHVSTRADLASPIEHQLWGRRDNRTPRELCPNPGGHAAHRRGRYSRHPAVSRSWAGHLHAQRSERDLQLHDHRSWALVTRSDLSLRQPARSAGLVPVLVHV